MLTASIHLPRAAKPEDVGVSSKAVAAFLQDIEESGKEVHNFMILRHGVVAAECFRAPFAPERPHQMYSVSKSFTAAAIGLAIHEGYFSLDAKVRDFFPEYTADIIDENLDQLTVHHLLCMTSGKDPSILADRSKADWIEMFFSAPWYAKPGAFKYINDNIFILSAIIKRTTGLCLRDFLQPRLFEPLGIDYPFWETDRNGIEAGGWGLYIKTEDLAKFMLCYANNGVFEGRQVLPAEWVALATAKQADNSAEPDYDSRAGYGYCFWHNADKPGSYRADGMFSQFGIVFPEQDAVLAITGAIPVEQEARDMIWRHFPTVFLNEEAPQQEDTSLPNLQEILTSSPLDRALPSAHCAMEQFVDGKPIHVRKTILLNLIGLPVSVLPLAVTYMSTEHVGNIDNIVLKFGENECSMTWNEGKENNTVICGMDGHFRYGTMHLGGIDYTVCCNAAWQNNNELVVNIRPIHAVAKRMLTFRFNGGNRVKIVPRSTPPTVDIARFLAGNIHSIIDLGETLNAYTAKLMIRLLPPFVEPTLRGKFVKK